MHLSKLALVSYSQVRPKLDLNKKLSRRLEGSLPLQIALIDLVPAKQIIPVHWATRIERLAVLAGVESQR
jgi:hypothetical protein